MTRSPARLLGSLVLLAAASVPAAGPAAPAGAEGAHGDALGLSLDGTTWSDSLTRPLFDPRVRWVPGDVRSTRFYVRNQETSRGRLTVDVVPRRRDALLDSGWLRVSARAAGQPWRTVTETGVQRLLTTDLDPDRPVLVEVRVALPFAAPNGTMVLGTDLDYRVTLVDRSAAAPDGGTRDDGDAGGGEILPNTGSAVAPWLPPLALALLGTGTFLVLRRRREEEEEPVEAFLSNDLSGLAPGLNPPS